MVVPDTLENCYQSILTIFCQIRPNIRQLAVFLSVDLQLQLHGHPSVLSPLLTTPVMAGSWTHSMAKNHSTSSSHFRRTFQSCSAYSLGARLCCLACFGNSLAINTTAFLLADIRASEWACAVNSHVFADIHMIFLFGSPSRDGEGNINSAGTDVKPE